MAKPSKKTKEQSFSKDYQKIMRVSPQTPAFFKEPQWLSNGDFFVKFSLYKEIPSIASTGTSLLQP